MDENKQVSEPSNEAQEELIGHDYSHPELGALYRNAKTHDELAEEAEAREELFANKRPKFVSVKVGMTGALVGIALIWLIQTVPVFFATGSIAVIFFTFLMALALLGAIVLWARFASDAMYAYAISRFAFWVGFSVIFSAEIVAVGIAWANGVSGGFIPLLFGAVMFVLVAAWSFTLLHARKFTKN